MADEQTDIVIVGGGAIGCCFAARLAAPERNVIVLEAGPAWNLGDLVSSQIRARRLKWGGSPVLRDGDNPFGNNMGTGWGFGGAALHHYAGWPRLHPADLATQSLHGRGYDWPFDYDELRPWYDRVQAYAGIAGDADQEIWRPPGEPYPMPPHPVFAQGNLIRRGFEALNMHVAAAPLAINSEVYGGRPPCLYDGWCDAGCPIQALANPLVLHKPTAESAGAGFRAGCTVIRINLDAADRARGVTYVDTDGNVHSIDASLVILAANPIQNARLLLASASEHAPDGVANSTGLVGRRFACHSISNIYGVFEEETQNHLGVVAGQLISQDEYAKELDGKPFGSLQWGIGPALKPNDLLGIANTRADLFGEHLVQFLEEDASHIASMAGICESLPDSQNRIELTDQRDAFDVPLAKVVHSFNSEALALWEYANRRGVEIFNAAGAAQAWSGAMGTAHPSGGTVMGNDPAESVCDHLGRCHDVANLWIGGAGLLPTIGAGSPTFTLYAMTERTADHLEANWLDYAA